MLVDVGKVVGSVEGIVMSREVAPCLSTESELEKRESLPAFGRTSSDISTPEIVVLAPSLDRELDSSPLEQIGSRHFRMV